jgi:pimeloyl-ACP methyl ester carboxylesterase
MEKHLTVKSGEYQLEATLHYPDQVFSNSNTERYPIIVFVHGFVGNRIGENRLFVRAARRFAQEGYLALRFDFAGCGESAGEYGETGLESFVTQTRDILDYVTSLDCVDLNRVIVVGHSLGGATALLAASKDKRVKKLVLWAPVGHPFSDIVKIVGNSTYEKVQIFGSSSYLGYDLTKLFFESLAYQHPFQEALKFTGDVYLVHGTADEEVPVDYTYLYEKLFLTRQDGLCEKEILVGADHRFTNSADARATIESSLNWLKHVEKQKENWYNWTI